MKKNVLLTIFAAILLSSCSTFNNFNHRKYFDFKSSTKDLSAQQQRNNNESSQNISLSISSIDTIRKNDFESTQANSDGLKKKKMNSLAPLASENSKPSYGGMMSFKKCEKKLISHILKKNQIQLKNSMEEEPKPKGQLWWLEIVCALIFFIIALFAYAGFFTFMAILFFLLGIWDLILYIKYKHKLAEWNKGSHSPQQEKPVEEPKEKSTEPKKKRG